MTPVLRATATGAAALSLAALGVAPARGAEPEPFRGHTSQGRAVRVDTDAAGHVLAVVVRWRSRCQLAGGRVRTNTYFPHPTRAAGARRFAERGAYRVRYSHGILVRYVVAVRGRKVSRNGWSGSFRARAVVRRRGRLIDRCRLGRIHWHAGRPTGRLTAAGDPGDRVIGANRYVFATPATPFLVTGDRREVHVQAGGFDIYFAPPRGQRLRTGGRYPHALRWPFNGRHPGLDVDFSSHGCNELDGAFRVRRAVFGPHGRIRVFAATFLQHCEHERPALRGTVSWRRG